MKKTSLEGKRTNIEILQTPDPPKRPPVRIIKEDIGDGYFIHIIIYICVILLFTIIYGLVLTIG